MWGTLARSAGYLVAELYLMDGNLNGAAMAHIPRSPRTTATQDLWNGARAVALVGVLVDGA